MIRILCLAAALALAGCAMALVQNGDHSFVIRVVHIQL